MKTPIFRFISFYVLLFHFVSLQSNGQTYIWLEDFESYEEGTGIEGPGIVYSGDYPDNVTKWTLDAADATLDDDEDYIRTHYHKMETCDVDGPVVWLCETIDISAHSSVEFGLEASESGSMEENDYFDVYYKVDSGDFTHIPNWNGFGSSEHTLIDDFPTQTITQVVNDASQLVIKVVMNDDHSSEYLKLDDVYVGGCMEYVSANTSQNDAKIAPGKNNQYIIGISIETSGSVNPLYVTEFELNANGSTVPVSGNIENARIFYTDTIASFAVSDQFGTTFFEPSVYGFTITGNQELLEGTNHFWLTFDTKEEADIGELVDAECISLTVGGSSKTPTHTAPAGSRTIANPLVGEYTIGAKNDYASFSAAASDLNNLGISGTTSFSVASGTYTGQVCLSDIDGTSTSDTILFRSSSGNANDVIVQETPTNSDNYVWKLEGTDYLTINNITIQTTGSPDVGRVLVFEGETVQIRIDSCKLLGEDVDDDDEDFAVVYGEFGLDHTCDSTTFRWDTISNGSYGIYWSGAYGDYLEHDNRFSSNQFSNYYQAGIFIELQNNVCIEKNYLEGKGEQMEEYGIMLDDCFNSTEVVGNQIYLTGDDSNYGIFLSECIGSEDSTGLVANNSISMQVGGWTTVGIEIMHCGYQDIINNSIHVYDDSKQGFRSMEQAGFLLLYYWTGDDYGDIFLLNNISNGPVKSINVSQTAVDNEYLVSSNNNNWYTTGSILGKWGSTECTDLTEWQNTSGHDSTSYSLDPEFVSNEYIAVTNDGLWETVPIQEPVDWDIDGMPRRNPTTPGAHKGSFIWTGELSGVWVEPDNWAGEVVPASDDDVVIPGDILTPDFDPSLTLTTEMRDLFMGKGALIDANNETIIFNGNVDISEGVLVDDHELEFSGSTSTSAVIDPDFRYNHIDWNKEDPNAEIDINIPANSDSWKAKNITLQQGTVNADGTRINLSVEVDISGGTLNADGLDFNGTDNSQMTSGSNILNSVIVDKDGNAAVDLQDDLQTIVLQIIDGQLNANSNNLQIAGDADLSGGNLMNDNQISFTGSENTSVVFSPDYRYNSIDWNKDNPNAEIDIDLPNPSDTWKVKDVTLNQGIINAESIRMDVSGDADLSGGTISAERIIFTGSSNSQFNSGTNTISHLVVNKEDEGLWSLLAKLEAGLLELVDGQMNIDEDIEVTDDVVVGTDEAYEVSMIVKPGKSIRVSDSLIIGESGLLRLKAEDDSTAKLIPEGEVVKQPEGQFIAEKKINGDEWHLISSPIENAVAGMFTGQYLQYHTESDNTWTDITSTSYLLEPMHGYSFWSTINGYHLFEFQGTPNSGNQTFDFVYDGVVPLGDYGWNLVGNPYPTTIDWTDIVIPDNLDGAIYRFDPDIGENGEYVYYLEGSGSNTSDQYVAMAQGFFVHCNDEAGGTLTITPDAMTDENAVFYKADTTQENSLVISVEDYPCSKAEVRFMENATYTFDSKYDVYRLFSSSKDLPYVFSGSVDNQLAVNSLPFFKESEIVPLGFKVGREGIYTLEFSGVASFDKSMPVVLKDHKNDVSVDLRESNSYSFSYSTTDAPFRFEILFNKETGYEVYEVSSVNISTNGQEIHIQGLDEGKVIIQLYNLSGKLIKSISTADHEISIRIGTKGFYLMRIIGQNRIGKHKLVIY
ncbi:MAG: T9SS type A sorting domain-containing protein [Bacteroidales bacterium]|nr:T9SS type A sorting domain-containing protein [Bacteroidales bacterium]